MNQALALGFSVIVVVLSLIPDMEKSGTALSAVSPRLQNLMHIPAFGLLALLWVLAFRDYGVGHGRSVGYAFVLATGLGFLLEELQSGIPGRYFSGFDLIFNLAGVVSFTAAYWIFNQRRSSAVKNPNFVAGGGPVFPAVQNGYDMGSPEKTTHGHRT